MSSEQNDVFDKLSALRASYSERLPDKVKAIKAAFDAAFRERPLDRESLEELRHLVHKLSGSAASFGYPDLGTAARGIELICNGAIDGQADPHQSDSTLHDEIEKYIAIIQSEARGGRSADPKHDEGAGETDAAALLASPCESGKRIFVISDNDERASRTLHELKAFGFDVTVTLDLDDLFHALEKFDFDVFVLDCDFIGDEHPGIDVLMRFRKRAQEHAWPLPPVVLMTNRSDLRARLKAVRAGIEVYLTKSPNLSMLVDVLDRYTGSNDDEPYRILVIDDEMSLARYTQLVLNGAGMLCRALCDPMNFLETIDDFSPELILMDLYMPETSGQELAAALRQIEGFAGIPIVFLSGEADLDKQLLALKQGGDDFLTKPITSEYLISSVKIRVQRFRRLRMLMARDSMTGLYNHTMTKQLLQSEISRAERDRSPLVLASVDIDHFKQVNDTYGHGVGDNVIKSLARLLRQRLRGVDVIGRMGGEEFAVIMPETLGIHAKGVFEEIRRSFSSIEHHAPEGYFNVTISCGIAEFPKRFNAAALSDAADKALYAAKHNGRDQVVAD